MTEQIPPPSNTARNRRKIFYVDIAIVASLVGVGTLFTIARQIATFGSLSAITNLISQACAVGAAALLVAGLWRRPYPRPSRASHSTSDHDNSPQFLAENAERTLLWKLMALRTAIGITMLQGFLIGISAVLH
ncbi:hypothetical protein [Rhizohabitans arisaemae]|uniref:hypothetical protein n=1 Tax=Rhizohabitans arisaemae TaxID=2720610 RepID=UPI0024B0904E|nr:hypothetical protein [Rhizohabitans arisaemae]